MDTLPTSRQDNAGAAPSHERFIASPAFDAVFFLASPLVTLLPWIAAERWHVQAWYILAGVGIASNGPHLSSTWTRVYLHRGDLARHAMSYVGVPLLLCGFVGLAVVVQGPGSELLRTILFYWAVWHFASQSWGILRIYQRKQGEPSRFVVRIERAAIYAGALWCMLHRIYTGPWELFGTNILHPDPPAWLVNGCGVVLIGLAIGVLAVRVRRAAQGRPSDLVRPLFIASSFAGFLVPFLLIRSDGTSAFAAAAAWHGVQYIGIVWHFNRRKFSGRIDPEAKIVSYVSQAGRAPLYALLLLALAGLAYLGLYAGSALTGLSLDTFGVLGWTSLTFGHYYLDGIIWKLRRRELSQPLGLDAQPA